MIAISLDSVMSNSITTMDLLEHIFEIVLCFIVYGHDMFQIENYTIFIKNFSEQTSMFGKKMLKNTSDVT